MDLFKKKTDTKVDEVFSLKSGTPIEISQINDKDFVYSHKTRLDEFLEGNEVNILAPVANGRLVKLSHNTEYSIIFKTNNGIFKNTMKIISYDLKDSVPLLRIKLLHKSQKIQRRQSFRLNTDLEFEFDVVEDASDETLKSDEVLLSKGLTSDISSGGIKFFTNENIEKGEYIKILINVKNLFVVAIGTIIYKEKPEFEGKYQFSYKCKFENIPKKYKEELSKYIFDVQRELSKKGRIFNK